MTIIAIVVAALFLFVAWWMSRRVRLEAPVVGPPRRPLPPGPQSWRGKYGVHLREKTRRRNQIVAGTLRPTAWVGRDSNVRSDGISQPPTEDSGLGDRLCRSIHQGDHR